MLHKLVYGQRGFPAPVKSHWTGLYCQWSDCLIADDENPTTHILHVIFFFLCRTVTSPIEGDGRLCFRVYFRVWVCLWTTSWRQFMSDYHQTWSVIPLATGDEVIKFWKVKVKGQGRWGRYAPYWTPLYLLLSLSVFLRDAIMERMKATVAVRNEAQVTRELKGDWVSLPWIIDNRPASLGSRRHPDGVFWSLFFHLWIGKTGH